MVVGARPRQILLAMSDNGANDGANNNGANDKGTIGDVNPAPKLRSNVKKYTPQFRNLDDVPYVGKIFISYDEAYEFYKKYARVVGFNLCKKSNKLSEDGKGYRWMEFVCSRQGITSLDYQEKQKHTKEHTRERKRGRTRCGCEAILTVTRRKAENIWVVSIFTVEHNHPLTSLGRVHLLKSNRMVTPV